jgi:23S rRNA pseudouridine2604 synthase
MAQRGLCSRREAERLIEEGSVTVNGVIVREQGCKAAPDADIRVAARGTMRLAAQVTVALHKPLGIVSTQPEPGQTPAWKLIKPASAHGDIDADILGRITRDAASLSVAGRLDRASRGLLILTQDGTVARRIIGGEGVEKCYVVTMREPVSDGQIRKLRGPLRLEDRELQPMHVHRVADDTLRFVLVGDAAPIRRVCRHVGLTVADLVRTAVGPIALGDLPEAAGASSPPARPAAGGRPCRRRVGWRRRRTASSPPPPREALLAAGSATGRGRGQRAPRRRRVRRAARGRLPRCLWSRVASRPAAAAHRGRADAGGTPPCARSAGRPRRTRPHDRRRCQRVAAGTPIPISRPEDEGCDRRSAARHARDASDVDVERPTSASTCTCIGTCGGDIDLSGRASTGAVTASGAVPHR